MLMLFTTIPPGRILYASDMPYGSGRYAALTMLRCAAQVGLGPDALRSIAGEQLDRIIAGQRPLDLEPAPGAAGLGERDLVSERGIAYLAVAAVSLFVGADPAEPVSLARLALRDSRRTVVAEADALAAQAEDLLAAHPETPRVAAGAIMAAQLVLGTPAAS
jgi:hypothetical protein